MKSPQTKFHIDTMSGPKLFGRKSQNLSLSQNFLQHSFFLFIEILLKLQQQISTCVCKF